MSESEDPTLIGDDEIPSYQSNISGIDVLMEGEHLQILPLSTEAELPSSGDTYMSQQSEHDESVLGVEEAPLREFDLEQSIPGNNLTEEEANSTECVSPSSLQTLDQSSSLSNQDSHCKDVPVKEEENVSTFQVIRHSNRKRKKRFVEETSSNNKKPRTASTSEDKESTKAVPVIEISSSTEKSNTLNDSQAFSLRYEDSSPPTPPVSAESETWKSHSNENNASGQAPSPGSLSQKNTNSWSSHNNLSPAWASHKQDDERKSSNSKNNSENNKLETMNSGCESPDDPHKENEATPKGRKVVVEERILHATVHWILDEENNTIIAGEIKQVNLTDEGERVSPRTHGRMSILSTTTTTSQKSSSSTGSVGMPGPFQLSGVNRMSIMSSVSSSSSSSATSQPVGRPAWDGPFLKPPVPVGTRVPLMCGHCNQVFPLVERNITPVVNGTSRIKEEELPVSKRISTPITRNRKGSKASQSTSSGQLDEEVSSSSSGPPPAPQAASTPTPVRKKGRPRKDTPVPPRRVSGSSPPPAKPKAPARTSATKQPTRREVAKSIESERLDQEVLSPPPSRARAATPVRTSATLKSVSGKGVAVMARWSDGRYYPGWVTSLPSPGTQAQVHFCDGQRKMTPAARLVPADVITAGVLVLVDMDDGDYEESLVIAFHKEGDAPLFQVERDNVQREVPFASIALLDSQVTELTMSEAQRVAATQNFNDLSLENIVSGPRKRPVRSFLEMARGTPVSKRRKRQATPEPSTSHGRTYGEPARRDLSVDSDSSCQSMCSIDLRGLEMKPLDAECSPPEVEQTSKTKLNTYRRNKNFKPKKHESENEHLVELLGPIPEEGSQLFSGCVFLVTYTSQVELSADNVVNSSSGETAYEDESANESSIPIVWKERLRTQIKRGGGRVCKRLSEVSKDELQHTYLITDKTCSTPLYLECVVNDVPIYSNSVIHQCCKQNKPFKEVLSARSMRRLPAGYSLARRMLVSPRSLNPLRGRRLLLALSVPHPLALFWQALVAKMGGTAEIFSGRCLERDRFDVVVTDPGCPAELCEQACQQQLPIVSHVWLQQCVINGDWRSYTEHPLYKHNADESPGSPEY